MTDEIPRLHVDWNGLRSRPNFGAGVPYPDWAVAVIWAVVERGSTLKLDDRVLCADGEDETLDCEGTVIGLRTNWSHTSVIVQVAFNAADMPWLAK